MTAHPLTDRQREVLLSLHDDEWLRPLDIGGSDRSHHSRTCAQLVRKGLAEEQRGGDSPRGTARHGFRYRRTAAGRAVVYGRRRA